MARKKVLFVCLGNSCRSQMAEALARHLASDVIEASSAGLIPLGYIAEPTRAVLTERGVECNGQTSKPLQQADVASCDLVINMSGRAFENFFDHDRPALEDWDVGDPFGSDLAVYQEIREEIERRVVELAERLREAGRTAR